MNIHAWIVAATGLAPDVVWRAYQNSGHDLPDTVDHITYFELNRDRQTLVHTERDLADPENVAVTRTSETSFVYTIRIFGPDRDVMGLRIDQGALENAPRAALAPAIYRQVVSGPRPVREERAPGWIEYVTMDVLIYEMEATVETVPAIQSSDLTGDVGGETMEVIEP